MKGLALGAVLALAALAQAEDSLNCRFIGSYCPAERSFARHVTVKGDFAFLSSGKALRIINVSDPRYPVEVGHIDVSELSATDDVEVVGCLAYVAAGWQGGLTIIDVSDPANPRKVGFYDTPGEARGLDVCGTLAYVADEHKGLRIVDVSDPANPYEVGSCVLTGGALVHPYAYDVKVSHGLAYVAAYESNLQIVDVSTPTSPRVVGQCGVGGDADYVDLYGDFAYVTSHVLGLVSVDVRDSKSPARAGEYSIWPGHARGLTCSDGMALVAADDGGLYVMCLAAPGRPFKLGHYDTPGSAMGVATSNGLIYVADGYSGLRIYEYYGPRY